MHIHPYIYIYTLSRPINRLAYSFKRMPSRPLCAADHTISVGHLSLHGSSFFVKDVLRNTCTCSTLFSLCRNTPLHESTCGCAIAYKLRNTLSAGVLDTRMLRAVSLSLLPERVKEGPPGPGPHGYGTHGLSLPFLSLTALLDSRACQDARGKDRFVTATQFYFFPTISPFHSTWNLLWVTFFLRRPVYFHLHESFNVFEC